MSSSVYESTISVVTATLHSEASDSAVLENTPSHVGNNIFICRVSNTDLCLASLWASKLIMQIEVVFA